MRTIKQIALMLFAALMTTSSFAIGVGDEVPDIALPSTGGADVNLRAAKGSWTVLYFYPKSFTPGCTREACGLRDARADIDALGATVLGVSTDNLETQKEFKAKYELTFDLLADEGGKLSEAFGVLGGATAKRVTFIINPEGRIAEVIDNVSVATHDQDVIRLLKKHMGEGATAD